MPVTWTNVNHSSVYRKLLTKLSKGKEVYNPVITEINFILYSPNALIERKDFSAFYYSRLEKSVLTICLKCWTAVI